MRDPHTPGRQPPQNPRGAAPAAGQQGHPHLQAPRRQGQVSLRPRSALPGQGQGPAGVRLLCRMNCTGAVPLGVPPLAARAAACRHGLPALPCQAGRHRDPRAPGGWSAGGAALGAWAALVAILHTCSRRGRVGVWVGWVGGWERECPSKPARASLPMQGAALLMQHFGAALAPRRVDQPHSARVQRAAPCEHQAPACGNRGADCAFAPPPLPLFRFSQGLWHMYTGTGERV